MAVDLIQDIDMYQALLLFSNSFLLVQLSLLGVLHIFPLKLDKPLDSPYTLPPYTLSDQGY